MAMASTTAPQSRKIIPTGSLKRCSWGTCNTDNRYPERCVGVKFIPFVKPGKYNYHLQKSLRWIRACGRPHHQLNVNKLKRWTYICSKHFVDGEPTLENPDPVSALGDNPKRRKLPAQRVTTQIVTSKRRKIIHSSDTENASDFNQVHALNKETTGADTDSIISLASSSLHQTLEQQKQHGHKETAGITTSFTASIDLSSTSTSQVQARNDLAYSHLLTQTLVMCKGCGKQVLLNHEDEKTTVRYSFMRMILKEDKSCFQYTGVPTVAFLLFLFNWISNATDKMKYWGGRHNLVPGRVGGRGRHEYKISKFEAMVLTLVRIRRGFDMTHLAFLFGISQGHVSRIFTTWVNLLSQCMKSLLLWPSKQLCSQNLPESFQNFPNTRCIIDCTEFKVERSFRPKTQRLTWSNYKHCNTSKLLVGIMPSGAIIYLSKLYVGSVSDRYVVSTCDFLSRIQPGDDVMADRGFNIRDLLLKKKATLNIPAFSRGAQLSMKAVKHSRKIASVRIHVERAIGRMKNFKLIAGVIRLKERFLLNQILTIVAVLCNCQERLC